MRSRLYAGSIECTVTSTCSWPPTSTRASYELSPVHEQTQRSWTRRYFFGPGSFAREPRPIQSKGYVVVVGSQAFTPGWIQTLVTYVSRQKSTGLARTKVDGKFAGIVWKYKIRCKSLIDYVCIVWCIFQCLIVLHNNVIDYNVHWFKLWKTVESNVV